MDSDSTAELELIDKVRAIYPTAQCVPQIENDRYYYRIEAEGKLWPLADDPADAWRTVLRDIALTLQKIKGNPKYE